MEFTPFSAPEASYCVCIVCQIPAKPECIACVVEIFERQCRLRRLFERRVEHMEFLDKYAKLPVEIIDQRVLLDMQRKVEYLDDTIDGIRVKAQHLIDNYAAQENAAAAAATPQAGQQPRQNFRPPMPRVVRPQSPQKSEANFEYDEPSAQSFDVKNPYGFGQRRN
jgi:hypothetical protein